MRSFSSLLCVSALPLILANCQAVQTPDDGRWGEAERIDRQESAALRPQVAIDATGNAIAVWDQTDNTTAPADASDDIWSNRRDAGGQWGSTELLEDHEPDDALEAQIAVDGEGNAIVVFRQSDGTFFGIWAVRYLASTGKWGEAVRIESNDTGDASRPQIAVDPAGNAVVVWQQGDVGQEGDDEDDSWGIWANRFTAGVDWGDAAPVDTSVQTLLAPQVAIDAKGNAIAVWERVDDSAGHSDIWSKHQTPTGYWTGAQPVEVDDRGNAWYPQIASDAEGNAIAVWQQQTDSERFDIYANRYLASTEKWGDAMLIETEDAGGAERPQVAIDEDGNAIAVWVQLGGDRAGIWSNRYLSGVGWEGAKPIGPTGLGSTRAPQIASDPEGNAVAVWVQFDGVHQDSVWSNRYIAGGGWGRSQAIETDDEFRVQGPQVAMDVAGNAVAVWSQLNGNFAFDVWSNRLSSSVSVK